MKRQSIHIERLRAFTLLEILVVVGIISILLIAIVPAVNSLSKSGGRKAAVTNLLGVIEQARNQAVKDGQATYVVFVDTLPAGASATMTTDYAFRSYAIFEDDSSNPGAQKQVSGWKKLPIGISIRTGSLNYLANTMPFPFSPMSVSSPANFPFLKFTAEGQVDQSTTRNPNATTGTINFGLFEGFVDSNGVERDTSSTRFTDTLAVSRLTGRAERM